MKQQGEFPLKIEIGFKKLFDKYRAMLDDSNEMFRSRAELVMDLEKKHPQLSKGLDANEGTEKYQKEIDLLFEDLFPAVLGTNEIKIASVPYREIIFKSSTRYNSIIENAGSNYELEMLDFDEDLSYVMGCSIVLMFHYGYKIDFRRPTYYNIPNADGIVHHYRVMYNADFTEIEKTDKAIDITSEDVDELLENFNNIELWKEKFPPNSWVFKGFVIATLFDVTSDVSISNFKTGLLKSDNKPDDPKSFNDIFKAIFNIPDLEIGYTDYNNEEDVFEKVVGDHTTSHILDGAKSLASTEALCETSYHMLFKQNEIYSVTNTKKYAALYPENVLYNKLLKQNVHSAIFAALVYEDRMLGILELTSKNINDLNTINAYKLKDIMPFLVEFVHRSKLHQDNEIELLIQNECTSIHPSVHWKFRKEAKRVLGLMSEGKQAVFKEVVFKEVHPLYGQIDIKGSSEQRNVAVTEDLKLQLRHVQKIINEVYSVEELPIYEQIDYRIKEYVVELKERLQVDTEGQVLNFLHTEIIPLFKHLSKKNKVFKGLISEYNKLVDETTGLVYQYRQKYDEAVMTINRELAAIIDREQRNAQSMYPHYFERFKTDGIEHNLYIGESITKKNSFNKVYLYNLRLWQLQVMCEMENSYYLLKEDLPVPLDVASMILVFNGSLALRFRMDEKRFDVDGTYNARYEVIKKRVDKANIKNTKERITQPGKISIIYSHEQDEKEYLKYISFLQSKNQLGLEVELHELEDLQGVTGLKAIRVNVLYKKDNNAKEYYTYEDLMKEINH